jgi:hypothetical protein
MSNREQAAQLRKSIAILQVAVAVEAIKYVSLNAELNEALASAQFLLVGLELEDGEVE